MVEVGGDHPPRRPRLLLAAGLGALLLTAGLIAALVVSLLRISSDDALASARSSALAAAKAYSADVGTYDYHHLAADFAVVADHSTPSFRATWDQSSSSLQTILARYHATSTATVVAAGLESATTSRAVADVFINQTVTNDTQKRPTTDQSRLQVSLVRQGGRWLIDNLKLL
jgi:Mce-associated membrane protein